jgi:tetratricopeptide (TPR) repeat protein
MRKIKEILKNPEYVEAIRKATEDINNDPKNIDAYIKRAKIQLKFGAVPNPEFGNLMADVFADGLKDLNKAIELDPNRIVSYLERGRYFKHLIVDIPSPVVDFDKAIELDPKCIDAYVERGEAYLWNAYMTDDSSFTAAICDFNKAIELDNKCAAAYLGLAKAKSRYKIPPDAIDNCTDPEGALVDLDEAKELNPKSAPFVHHLRGLINEYLERYDAAISDFGSAINSRYYDWQRDLWNRAFLYYKTENFVKAIEDLDFLIQSNKQSKRFVKPSLYELRGLTKFNNKDFTGALDDFNKALEFSVFAIPHDREFEINIRLNLIETLEKLGKKDLISNEIEKIINKINEPFSVPPRRPLKNAYYRAMLENENAVYLDIMERVVAYCTDETAIDNIDSAIRAKITDLKISNELHRIYKLSVKARERLRKEIDEKHKLEYEKKFEEMAKTVNKIDKQSENTEKIVTKISDEQLPQIMVSLSRLNTDINGIKSSNLETEEKLQRIFNKLEDYAKREINSNPQRFEIIRTRVADKLNIANFDPKTSEDIIKTLATAEYIMECSKETEMDYSGIIICYCKAVEIALLEKCRSKQNELEKLLRNTDVIFISNNLSLQKKYQWMEDNTISYDGKRPIFYKDKFIKQLIDFKKYGLTGDTYRYTTLLYYFFVSSKLDATKFRVMEEIIRDVYHMYNRDRNGSAHTSLKTINDMHRVRNNIMGTEDQQKSGLIYRILHEL